MKKRRRIALAFTLIELLVVIAIIALLVSILMPALNYARESARGVVCMTNVRRLAISIQLYQDANNGQLPPDRLRWDPSFKSGETPYIVVGKYRRFRPRWIWFLDEGMGNVINPYKYQTEEDFNEALEMDNDSFMCPSLKSFEYANSIRNGAYGYNYQYLGNSRPFNGQPANYPVRNSRIKRPSETIVFGDSRGADIPHGQHAYLFDPPKMAWSKNARDFAPKSPKVGPLKYSPADGRHHGKANIAFLDSHAESMTYEEMGYEVDPDTNRPVEKGLNEIGGPGSNRLWSGTGHDEPDYQ